MCDLMGYSVRSVHWCWLHVQVYEQWDKSAIHGEQSTMTCLCCSVTTWVGLELFQRIAKGGEASQAPATCRASCRGLPDDTEAPCRKPAYCSISSAPICDAAGSPLRLLQYDFRQDSGDTARCAAVNFHRLGGVSG